MTALVLHLEYEIRTTSGELVESSARSGRLEFVPGRRLFLPALERVIARLRVGEEVKGELEAAHAFGDESILPTMEILRAEFTGGEAPEPGRKYEARTVDGNTVNFRVLSANDRFVHVRLLHPLADADLVYRFKLIAVEDRSSPPPLPGHALGIDSSTMRILEAPLAKN